MGRFKFVILLILPLFGFAQDYPRFELYQLVQGADSGQFVTTGVDSNLDFNSVLRFRFQDSTLLIGSDTVITDAKIVPILLATIDAGLGIEVSQVNGQIFIESLSIEDSIYNGSGSIIEKGTPLYAADTQGNYWDVAPADASDQSKMPVVVIAGEEIGIGEVGLGLIKGHIKQVNTTGLADGAEVYVASGGGYTSTKPTAEGVIVQRLGTVIKGETTNGSGIINLGDEGFWNDYTSLTKLRDTLVLVRGSITTEISDSLTNYASKTELADTANNIRTSITSELSDSLINYPNRIELGDTALAIRNTIPIQIEDSLVNYASRTELADTALAIRSDFPTGSGDVTTAQLADTASAIRGDIPSLPLTLGTQTDGNYIATGGTSGNGISGSATGEGSTFTVTSNATTNNTANTIVFRNASGNFSAGTITAALSGNSSTATKLQTSRTISLTSDVTGSASFDGSANASITATVVDDSHNHVISNVDFLSDSLSALRTAINAGGGGGLWSEGATPGEIYYNSGNVGIGNTDPDYPLHVTGDGYFTDDLLVFDRIYLGSDFNHTSGGYSPYIDRYAATGETGMDFYAYMSNSSFSLYRFIDSYDSYSTVFQLNPAASTYQAIVNGAADLNGNFTQSGTIVQDGGSVTFNNTQSGSYDFGVGSLNHLPFMWVDASADKMAVGGGTPAYTLDVTGDINFTGNLYDDGVLFSGGGVTINNNTDNYLLTASGTANTINGEANLTYNGTKLSVSGRIEQTGIGFSTLFGLDAGLNDDLTNNYSTAFGYNALKNNTTGIYNSAFGVRALESITSGSSNNAFGIAVLENTTTGSNNSGFGNSALNDVTTGTYNAVFGNASGDLITTGKQNTIFGSLSGRTLTTGDYNVFIGSDVGASSNSTTNEIAIGYDAAGQGSNTIMLGNSSITDLYCYDTSISSPSDKRDKKKIKSLKSGLDFVRELRPVIFQWDMREGTKKGIKDIGFVAQELNKVEKNTNEFEYINLTKHDKKLDRWFAQYSNLIPVYAKAIQDLDDKVNQQQVIIESQDKRIRQLEEIVKQLIEKK